MSSSAILNNSLPLLLVLSYSCSTPSDQDNQQLSHEEIAHEIIRSSGTCTLITLDSIGQPRARVMDPFQPQDGFVIWFGTNTKSRKVTEIASNGRATLNYFDKAAAAYVSLYGQAEIVYDDALKSQFWKEKWRNFYPNYPDGYCLIKFTPDYLELISEKHSITGDPVTWKPARISF